MKKSLRERQLDAEFYCNRWLADGNEALENGDKSKADFCFAKSQFWLDRSNLLLGHRYASGEHTLRRRPE